MSHISDEQPQQYADELSRHLLRRQLYAEHDHVTTKPSLVAAMVAGTLRLAGDESVLDVGTGHGWQTALLAET